MLRSKSPKKFSSFKSHPWRVWLDESYGLKAKDVVNIVLRLEKAPREVTSSKYAMVHVYEQTVRKKEVRLCVKRYLHRGFTDKLKHVVRKDRASREARANLELGESGFETPRTIAWGFWQKQLFKENCFLITQEIPGKRPLPEIVGLLQDFESRSRLLEELAGTVARMHNSGFFHGDMRARNIFTSQNLNRSEFCFLDNERTRKFLHVPKHLRVKNLVQLDLLIVERMEVAERKHFFQEYVKASKIKNGDSLVRKVMCKTDNRVRRLVRLGRMAKK